MADPMDYTMEEGHAHPPQIPNTAVQCQYQPPQQSPNSNSFAFQAQDAHHYDPVYNTESWQANGRGLNRFPPLFPPHSGSQLPAPMYGSWQGYGEVHRGTQGPDVAAYQQHPQLYTGMPHSPWAEPRSYEPYPPSFGYTPGMYGENSAPNGPNTAARSSVAASAHPQGSPMRRYPTVGHLPGDYVRGPRGREEALRNYNERVRRSREAAGLPPNPLHIPGSYDYLPNGPLGSSRSRRHDNPDWDSEDDDDHTQESDNYPYTNPYRASLIFNSSMDDERRMAAARGALAAAKRVPSKEFVASLEKLDPKDLKEADRTCMICYNEFGIQNPDGIVEQPIRLPKCKHVFGDKCIKKWFEDSDSCPYCRDKLPSEQIQRKHPPIDQLYHAQSRRVHLAAALAAQQAQGARARTGLGRATDELSYGSSRHYVTQSQEDYHYMMRGSGAPDAWSHSPPRARDSENRRRQARGRASLGRPTSVGSVHQARLVAPMPPNPHNAQRPQLQNITPNTMNSLPATGPRRPITPGLTRQHSTGPGPTTAVTPVRSRLSEASSSPSSEEASPPVAVGSGIAAGGHSPPGSWRTYRDYINGADPYHSYLASNNHSHFPGRPPNSRADTEPHSGQTISSESRFPSAEYGQRHGELGLVGSVSNENRWSR